MRGGGGPEPDVSCTGKAQYGDERSLVCTRHWPVDRWIPVINATVGSTEVAVFCFYFLEQNDVDLSIYRMEMEIYKNPTVGY